MTDLEIVSRLQQDERVLLMPLVRTTKTFWRWAALMAAVTVWGAFAYAYQLKTGLGATGLNTPEYWGIYIICFVFFIGISHAGTLISAILRVANAEWRRSITRSAEFITVLVIGFGAVQPILDLGRPDRVLNVFLHAQPFSPLLWDVMSIGLYFTASSIYLYVPMIPDLARIRDLGLRPRLLYWFLAIGYRDSPQARHTLERMISILAVMVIPIAVSVHTVIGWIFALTLRPMWHSAIFGPYFVMGAIFSGIAALIIAMAILRRVYRLEAYFKDVHFNHMGVLLFVMTVLWFYFTFAEHLTVWYGGEEAELATLYSKLTGAFAFPFWLMVAFCFVVPFALMARRATRNVTGTVVASVAVVIGMWLERFNIVVPTSLHPRGGMSALHYVPSWVELSIMAGTLSGFILVYMVATKFFPIISIWEIQEGREKSIEEVSARVAGYLPDDLVTVER
ncbi:MAG TPA: NrfD/PsrC family molybdoenzyme membrane anchor subunit [Candidatus Limnocylindria bacterium]|nr:NrfD/PsrC family molybdoenzyme membrane anchor subunit [Candidatus Limnocylindria bacterium]